MRSTIALSVAALAGSVLAAPSNYGGPVVENVHWVYETVVHTAYEVEGSQPTPAPAPEAPQYGAPQYSAPAVPSPAPEKTKSASVVPSPVYAAPAPAAPTPAPAAPSASAEAPSSGSDSGYMAVVSKWRKRLGLKQLTKNSLLESNALKCVTDGNGHMQHELNEGTYGQVLAEGAADAFEHVYVGGWLCEIVDTPGLGKQVCDDASKGWSYNDASGIHQDGHAKILKDPSYSMVGCAWYNGIWGCDLA